MLREMHTWKSKVNTGRIGEREAEDFLLKRGLRTLERNWRYSHKEVDLIMAGEDAIHFVEVRSLTAPSLIKPYESLGFNKKRNLMVAASAYMALKHINKEISLDVVSVQFFDGEVFIEYFCHASPVSMHLVDSRLIHCCSVFNHKRIAPKTTFYLPQTTDPTCGSK